MAPIFIQIFIGLSCIGYLISIPLSFSDWTGGDIALKRMKILLRICAAGAPLLIGFAFFLESMFDFAHKESAAVPYWGSHPWLIVSMICIGVSLVPLALFLEIGVLVRWIYKCNKANGS